MAFVFRAFIPLMLPEFPAVFVHSGLPLKARDEFIDGCKPIGTTITSQILLLRVRPTRYLMSDTAYREMKNHICRNEKDGIPGSR